MNPIKFIFGSIFSWVILAVVVAGGYLGYVNYTAQEFTPEGVVDKFSEMIENPTDVVSSTEKTTINNIVDTGAISGRKFETLVLGLRELNREMPLSVGEINIEEPFADTTLTFQNPVSGELSPQITVFMEQYGDLFSGVKHRIIHFEFTGFEDIQDVDLEKTIIDTLEDISESVTDSFNELKENYGDKIFNFFRSDTDASASEE